LQHDNSAAAWSPCYFPSDSSLSANDTFVAASASATSPLSAVDPSTTSSAGLNLVVDF